MSSLVRTSPFKTESRMKHSLSFIDTVSIQDSLNLNQSAIVIDPIESKRASLQKSRSTMSLLMKDRQPPNIEEPSIVPKDSILNSTISFHDLRLVFQQTQDNKFEQSLNNSIDNPSNLFQKQELPQEDSKPKQKLKHSATNRELNTNLILDCQVGKNVASSAKSVLPAKKNADRGQSNPGSRTLIKDLSPSKKSAGSGRPGSYNDAVFKNISKTILDESKDKSPSKKSIYKKVAPFFLNVPSNPCFRKSNNQANNSTLKDKIKQKILDLVDPNEFKVPCIPFDKHKGSLGHKQQLKNHILGSPPLKPVQPVGWSPAHPKESESKNFQIDLDQMRSSVENILGEPYSFIPKSSKNASYLSFVNEKTTQESSINRQNSWSSLKKSQPSPKKSAKQPLMKQRTVEYNNVDRTKNDFSFKMTYFKPIDESTLDEFIQNTTMSRTQKKSFVLTNQSVISPRRKKENEIKEKKIPDKSSQEILNNSRELSNSKKQLRSQKTLECSPKKESIVRGSTSPKPKSISAYRGSHKVSVDTKANLKNNKLELESPKSINKRKGSQDEVEMNLNNKSCIVLTPDNKKRHGKSVDSLAVVKKEGKDTYFKLDKLLQELKNNSQIPKIDESNSVTDTTSENGLFTTKQTLETQHEGTMINTLVDKSFKKAFISMRESNR